MTSRSLRERVSRFLRAIYLKLFRINDTPQKIAMGLGLGVFLGVLPGAGPIAAFTLSLIFRVNRASALLGSILTNTWLSIPVFLVSLRAGAAVMGLDYGDLRSEWTELLKDFHWKNALDAGIYTVVIPILAGYALVALSVGLAVYTASLLS